MLTEAQQTTLRNFVLADPTFGQLPASNGSAKQIADSLNELTNPAFIVWRTNVTADEIGNAWVGTDIDGMSALNMQRLQLLLASSTVGVFDMRRADRRAGFENPFGTNVSNASRVAMRAVWKKTANGIEKLLATGTGSDASPGLVTFEGEINYIDVNLAMGWVF